MEMNRIQLIVLSILRKTNATNPASSISIANIQEMIPLGKSYSTIYRYVTLLDLNQYISCGVKDGKFKTYFITKKGQDYIKELNV